MMMMMMMLCHNYGDDLLIKDFNDINWLNS